MKISAPKPPKPPARLLGRTRLRVSELGFGGWGIGKSMWGPTDDDESLRVLRRALELGVGYFDTALVYGSGRSEKLIGQALKEAGQTAVVATAVPPKNMEWPAKPYAGLAGAFPPDWVVSCVERSLRNLRVERLDVEQLHVWHDHWLKDRLWPQTLAALLKLKEQGKIRFLGLSTNSNDPDSALEAIGSGVFDCVQVSFNLFDQRPRERLLPLCAEKDVGVVARCPLDEGGLTGALTPHTRFEPSDFRGYYFGGERLAETCRRAKALEDVLVGPHAPTLAQAAVKFCLSFPEVSAVIPGMRKLSHVEENVRAADGRYFGRTLLETLKAHAWVRDFYN